MGQQVPLEVPVYPVTRRHGPTNVILYPVHGSIRQIKIVVMMPRIFTDTEISEESSALTYRV